jgi:hypothetical protein
MKVEAPLPEVPWPVTGDKVFTTDTDWWHNACLGFGGNKWDLYATGYKEAADIIVDQVVETGLGMDTLIYPVAFLYRHYLELRLKEIIIHGQQLLDRSSGIQHLHRIDVLWFSCRHILEEIWPEGSNSDLDAVEACIIEFCQVDQQSTSFRYPITKDGSPTLPSVEHINLRHLKSVLGRIASLLEGSSMAISVYLDEKNSHEEYYL